MIAHHQDDEYSDSKYFLVNIPSSFLLILTIAGNHFGRSTPATTPESLYHYTDAHADDPAPETKRKEPPTTTSAETTIVTKKIKVEGSGSRGRIRTADFNDMTRSIIEDSISIYRAQISSVEPFPERTEDCDTIKQVWLEVCEARNVRVELEEDIFKLVCHSNCFLLFVAMISLCRLSDALHNHEVTLKPPRSLTL